MIIEIKVIEEHFPQSKSKPRTIEEVPNSSGKLGSKQIESLNNKFQLVSSNTYHYDCRNFDNVTVFVTSYIFSDKKDITTQL
tara:strand:+ start:4937 stop:5182 length:246 start_codon:yes stop_codon:yes gene_type:complete